VRIGGAVKVQFSAAEAAVILWRLDEKELAARVQAFTAAELSDARALASSFAGGTIVVPTKRDKPELALLIAMACIAVVEGRPRQLRRERMLSTARMPGWLRGD
jgi:hypothetical protein